MSAAASTIVVYVILIPFALWAALKWTARPVDSDLISDEVICFCPKEFSNLNFSFQSFFIFPEWSLYTEFLGTDLHIRLLTWNLYSRFDSMGYSDFIFAMVACVWGRTDNWHRFDYNFEPCTAQFQQIGLFNRRNFVSSFPIGGRFHASFLSYASQRGHYNRCTCANNCCCCSKGCNSQSHILNILNVNSLCSIFKRVKIVIPNEFCGKFQIYLFLLWMKKTL